MAGMPSVTVGPVPFADRECGRWFGGICEQKPCTLRPERSDPVVCALRRLRAVPEPGSLVLAFVGLLGMMLPVARKRRPAIRVSHKWRKPTASAMPADHHKSIRRSGHSRPPRCRSRSRQRSCRARHKRCRRRACRPSRRSRRNLAPREDVAAVHAIGAVDATSSRCQHRLLTRRAAEQRVKPCGLAKPCGFFRAHMIFGFSRL